MRKYVLALCLCAALLLTGCNGAQSEIATNPSSIEAESSITSDEAQQNAETSIGAVGFYIQAVLRLVLGIKIILK